MEAKLTNELRRKGKNGKIDKSETADMRELLETTENQIRRKLNELDAIDNAKEQETKATSNAFKLMQQERSKISHRSVVHRQTKSNISPLSASKPALISSNDQNFMFGAAPTNSFPNTTKATKAVEFPQIGSPKKEPEEDLELKKSNEVLEMEYRLMDKVLRSQNSMNMRQSNDQTALNSLSESTTKMRTTSQSKASLTESPTMKQTGEERAQKIREFVNKAKY